MVILIGLEWTRLLIFVLSVDLPVLDLSRLRNMPRLILILSWPLVDTLLST